MKLKKSRYDLPKYGADGHFGKETLKAVNNFKDDYGIYNRDIWKGVVAPKTENRLNKEVAKMNVPKPQTQIPQPAVEVPETSVEGRVAVEETGETEETWLEKTGDYLWKSGKQVVLGNYTDEVTVLGTAGQIVIGILGVDAPMDIINITYDITHWEWSWSHAGKTALDIVAIAPGVGALKYTDEAGTLLKQGLKNVDKIDEATDTGKALIKGTGNAISKTIYKNLDEGLNFASTPAKHVENPGRYVPVDILRDAIKSTKGVADPRGSNALMHYTTMYKNGKMYNLEVLYDKATNTIYHFEYTRKAIGNLPKISK